MSGVARWLDARRPPMPSELRTAVYAACEARPAIGPAATGSATADASDATLADRLAEAGLEALGRVAGAPPERGTAIELLAADTLLTYACEAAAEAGPATLDRLTARLGYARFATLLEPSS